MIQRHPVPCHILMSHSPHLNFNQVLAALNAVYNGSGASHSEADRWLQEFQRSQEAWSVSFPLFATPLPKSLPYEQGNTVPPQSLKLFIRFRAFWIASGFHNIIFVVQGINSFFTDCYVLYTGLVTLLSSRPSVCTLDVVLRSYRSRMRCLGWSRRN